MAGNDPCRECALSNRECLAVSPVLVAYVHHTNSTALSCRSLPTRTMAMLKLIVDVRAHQLTSLLPRV